VAVAVMQIRVMRMAVPQRRMHMPVRMRLGHRPVMAVPMVQVVNVGVLVPQRLVLVFVVMAFG
jgi:hypothetical protein